MTKATRSLIASEIGIERARKALIDLGINQTGLEERLGFSRSTISSFFNRTKPIDHPYFTKICKTLNLEWEEIVEKDNPMKLDNSQIENTTDVETNSPRLAAFVIEGSFPVDVLTRAKIQALVKQLQKITGDASLEIVDIQEGSIKIILKGTPEALATIQALYNSDQLNELVRQANLSGANLSESDLSGANLSESDLSGANLSKSDLSRAHLSRANLSESDLSGANLSRARLFETDLSGAKLRGADLSKAYLTKADLSRAKLSGANLFEANLREAKLRGANIREANLSGANLTEANLFGTYLFGAYFRRAYFRGFRLQRVRIFGVRLFGSDLFVSGARLYGANLFGSDLSGADLSGADLSEANFFGVNLRRADLSGANLFGTDLSGADLSYANVKNARFANNLGISEDLKLDLIDRGAIFDDSSGDRSRVLTPV